jgi:hypothetical protein
MRRRRPVRQRLLRILPHIGSPVGQGCQIFLDTKYQNW